MKYATRILGFFAVICLPSCSYLPPNNESPVDNGGQDKSWSTNFADVTDPATAEIYAWIPGNQLSIDTSNVNSGGKSIKVFGSVDDQHILQATFSVHGLTGKDTIDLSDKALSFEIYVPSGPPLSMLSIDLMSGNDSVTARANIYAQRGRWYTYEADTKMAITLGSWRFYDYLHSSGISSSADAVNLLKHAQYIRVNAGNYSDLHEAGDAYFLVDKLGWETAGALPAYDPTADSLRKYAEARSLPIGGDMFLSPSSDPQFVRIFLQEFDTVESQESMYWPATEPAGDNFDTAVPAQADVFLDNVAGRLGSQLVRYLVFDNLPDWLTAKSYEEAQTILENYVRAKVGYYKGSTKIWFVFNELLRYDIGWVPYTGLGLKDRNQVPQTWSNNYSPFSDSPSDVTQIEAAFQAARETDQGAWLFLLDGGNEEMGHAKPDAFYNLVAKLVSDGTPIDGVGLQAHLEIGADGNVRAVGDTDLPLAYDSTDGLTGIAQNVERFQALGLKVVFSEVDVPVYAADIDSSSSGQALLAPRLQIQADVYRNLMHITLTHSMPAFIFFSWADQYSWYLVNLNGLQYYGYPGIFDADFKPKPAYYALLDELKTH